MLAGRCSACQRNPRSMGCRSRENRGWLCDFHVVDQTGHSGNSLAAIDAKLAFVKGIHAALNSDNTLAGFDFNRPQPWKMLGQEIGNSPFKFTVQLTPAYFLSVHFFTSLRKSFCSPATSSGKQLVCRQFSSVSATIRQYSWVTRASQSCARVA